MRARCALESPSCPMSKEDVARYFQCLDELKKNPKYKRWDILEESAEVIMAMDRHRKAGIPPLQEYLDGVDSLENLFRIEEEQKELFRKMRESGELDSWY